MDFDKEKFQLIFENEFVWECYDKRCKEYRKEILDKPDINGIDLHRYDVVMFIRKSDYGYVYVLLDPTGNPIHEIHGLEEFSIYCSMLRMNLAYENNLIEMAYKVNPELREDNPREKMDKMCEKVHGKRKRGSSN